VFSLIAGDDVSYLLDAGWRPRRRFHTQLLPDAGEARPIDHIRYVVMDDPSTRWLSFLTGEIDLEAEIPRDNWDAVVTPDGLLSSDLANRGIRMHAQPSLDCFYIGFNMDDPVVGANRALRQALNAAFNFPAWALLNPCRVDAATGPVPPNVAGRLETPFAYAYDLDLARRLLSEAGYPEGLDPATGRRLVLQLELGRTDQETRESTELLAAFLDRIGVVLEAHYNNWPTFLQKVGRREAQMFRVGWLADYPDAENFLQLFYSHNASPGPNRCNYNRPEYDALFEEALAATSENERLERYRKMQQMIREECPWIFLYHRRDVILTQQRLRNFQMHDFPYGMEKHWRIQE